MTKAQARLLLTVAKIVRRMVFWDGVTNKYEAIKALDRDIKAVEREGIDEGKRA